MALRCLWAGTGVGRMLTLSPIEPASSRPNVSRETGGRLAAVTRPSRRSRRTPRPGTARRRSRRARRSSRAREAFSRRWSHRLTADSLPASRSASIRDLRPAPRVAADPEPLYSTGQPEMDQARVTVDVSRETSRRLRARTGSECLWTGLRTRGAQAAMWGLIAVLIGGTLLMVARGLTITTWFPLNGLACPPRRPAVAHRPGRRIRRRVQQPSSRCVRQLAGVVRPVARIGRLSGSGAPASPPLRGPGRP